MDDCGYLRLVFGINKATIVKAVRATIVFDVNEDRDNRRQKRKTLLDKETRADASLYIQFLRSLKKCQLSL